MLQGHGLVRTLSLSTINGYALQTHYKLQNDQSLLILVHLLLAFNSTNECPVIVRSEFKAKKFTIPIQGELQLYKLILGGV